MEDGKLVQVTEEVNQKNKQIAVAREVLPLDKLMEMSEMLAKSTIVPMQYQHRQENCFIALDLASRMGVSPMMVMQNLYIIQGKPSFSGQALASLVRSSGLFTNVEINYIGEPNTDSWGAYISATRLSNGKILKGATVTIAMSKMEGWYQKTGSKWKTIPELMLGYRAYAFFARVHSPELTMGLHSVEEVEDISTVETVTSNPFDKGDK